MIAAHEPNTLPAINQSGTVVGMSQTSASSTTPQPFIWKRGWGPGGMRV